MQLSKLHKHDLFYNFLNKEFKQCPIYFFWDYLSDMITGGKFYSLKAFMESKAKVLKNADLWS